MLKFIATLLESLDLIHRPVRQDQNEKMKIYLEFYKSLIDLGNKRRDFEWKFNLALWTPLAVMIGFALKGELSFSESHNCALLLVHSLLFVIYVFIWTYYIQERNYFDRRYALAYKKAIEDFLNGATETLAQVTAPQTPGLEVILNRSAMTQIMITGALLSFNVLLCWK